ncbi:MAG: NAD(+) synthase [Oscillospiraceae bacterium]|nr:NAD(+) synthase [Oscillospiraceae bacterium]
MRNWANEVELRVQFIRDMLQQAGAAGVVFGNSGGKDSALVGMLCKLACDNTVGIIMPCSSARNYTSDKHDALALAQQCNIATREIDLTDTRAQLLAAIGGELPPAAVNNLAPRLRMTTLYAIAAAENLLVAGASNASERYMGYFTKWGDGACDFNPIADLTVAEVFACLRHLQAPAHIIEKAPSAGLFEGQTDEAEMGVSYASIDALLLTGSTDEHDAAIIERAHRATAHKRQLPAMFAGEK